MFQTTNQILFQANDQKFHCDFHHSLNLRPVAAESARALESRPSADQLGWTSKMAPGSSGNNRLGSTMGSHQGLWDMLENVDPWGLAHEK